MYTTFCQLTFVVNLHECMWDWRTSSVYHCFSFISEWTLNKYDIYYFLCNVYQHIFTRLCRQKTQPIIANPISQEISFWLSIDFLFPFIYWNNWWIWFIETRKMRSPFVFLMRKNREWVSIFFSSFVSHLQFSNKKTNVTVRVNGYEKFLCLSKLWNFLIW